MLYHPAVLGGKPLVERQFEEDNARGAEAKPDSSEGLSWRIMDCSVLGSAGVCALLAASRLRQGSPVCAKPFTIDEHCQLVHLMVQFVQTASCWGAPASGAAACCRSWMQRLLRGHSEWQLGSCIGWLAACQPAHLPAGLANLTRLRLLRLPPACPAARLYFLVACKCMPHPPYLPLAPHPPFTGPSCCAGRSSGWVIAAQAWVSACP